MEVRALFHAPSSTLTYVLYDQVTRDAVIIDPVLDFDKSSESVSDGPIKELLAVVSDLGLKIHAVLETHIHADHVSGSKFLKHLFPNAVHAMNERVVEVQRMCHGDENLRTPELTPDGSHFDTLLHDQQVISAGSLQINTIFTPGHTPACTSFLCGNVVFTGDVLFMPDFGTGRCDFPGGSADDLYNSVHGKLYALPDETRVFVGHDYQPGGRPLAYESTIGEEKRSNIHIKATTSQEEYVSFRKARDATLAPPGLIVHSLRANAVGGARAPAAYAIS